MTSTIIRTPQGGTGLATLTANNVILGNGTSAPLFVAPGTSNNVLTSNGTTWTSAAPGGGTLVLLNTQTASASATIDFTSTYITTTYKEYLVELINVQPATDGQLLKIRLSQGGTFVTTAGAYQYIRTETDNTAGGLVVAGGNTSDTLISVNSSVTMGNATNENCCGTFTLFDPTKATLNKKINWFVSFNKTDGSMATCDGGAEFILNTNACDGVRFFFNSGNIAIGTFNLYGVL